MATMGLAAFAAAGVLAVTLGACAASSTTPLPELAPAAAGSMLPPAQQQKAIEDLAKKKAEQEQLAVKKIEQTR